MSDDALILMIERRPDGLRLIGDIDAASVDALAGELDPLPGTDADVIIDLAEVTFIDSSGFRTLVEAHQRAEKVGRRVVMADPSVAVRRLFDISGLVPYLYVGTIER
jgi:anti-sigma B factor antagonist